MASSNCSIDFSNVLDNYETNLNCIQSNLKIPLKSNQILVILIIVFISTFICLIYCFKKSWNSIFSGNKQPIQTEDEVDLELFNNLDSFQYLFSKFQHLEYPYNKLIFIRDIGNGEFGRVVQAKAPKLNSINRTTPEFTTINMMNNMNSINENDEYTVVAVKMLKKNEQRKFLKRNLIKEAYLMAQFNHPNLIQLLGISITPQDHIYLLFEYMSKGDLNAFLRFRSPSNQLSSANFRRETNLTELSLLRFAQQIADGMKYLSNLNFVHRTLSTRNCLINDNLIVKICDFGLSLKLTIDQNKDSNSFKNFKRGNWKIKNDEEEKLIKNERLPIRWLAPESLLFDHFSIKSDVWSFGILLWELYSFAKQPYSEIEDNKMVIKFVCDGNRLKKPDLAPKSVFNLMKKCWDKNADSRPSFDKILNNFKSIEIELIKKEKKTAKLRQKELKKNSVRKPEGEQKIERLGEAENV